jgi:squalene-hopene/tetraprenyl-beta-curcumene cyclase
VLTISGTVGAQSLPATKPAASQPVNKAIDRAHAAMAEETFEKGYMFLAQQQLPDGGWGFDKEHSHPGLTAMVLKILLADGLTTKQDLVSRGFAALMTHRRGDGGFYDEQEGNQNYNTSLAVMALAAANDPAHKEALNGAVKYLRGEQITPGSKTPDGKDVDEKNPWVGGVSYGQHGRPDLSNVGMWMEAMHEAGVKGDDPAMQRALGFVQRLQNRSEGTENQSFVLKGEEDGGFIYAIVFKDGKYVGESYAGDTDRGLRSYGSMTYTGFKSMLYANLTKSDPRVKAAMEWIGRYWRLDSNPNMPQKQSLQGLYYYYQVFAKALRAWGQDEITDAKGVKHNWRNELIEALKERQTADGSWANNADRWMEGSPILVTAYCLSALQDAMAP